MIQPVLERPLATLAPAPVTGGMGCFRGLPRFLGILPFAKALSGSVSTAISSSVGLMSASSSSNSSSFGVTSSSSISSSSGEEFTRVWLNGVNGLEDEGVVESEPGR